MKENVNPLFVSGFPRSGTTLFRSLLNTSPDIHLANEPEILFSLYKSGYTVNSRWDASELEGVIKTLKASSRLCRRYIDGVNSSSISHLQESGRSISFKAVYEALMAESMTTKIWGEKGLNQVYYAKEISKIYPDAFFIFITRDPRSVAASLAVKRMANESGRKTIEYSSSDIKPSGRWLSFFAYTAECWRHWIGRMFEALDDPSMKKRALIVKFEDLVKNPHDKVSDICEAVGARFSPRMLEPCFRVSDPVITSGETGYAHARMAGPVDPERSRAFSSLHPMLECVCEKTAGNEARGLGYMIDAADRTGFFEKLIFEYHIWRRRRNIRKDVETYIALRA